MQPKVIVSKNRKERDQTIWEILAEFKINQTNPDILTLDDEKIGIKEVKQIIKHLSSKPFGKTAKSVVIFDGNNISLDGQNALLKTLEEPPGESIILIGTDSQTRLLPTVLSRCRVVNIKDEAPSSQFDLGKILQATIEERFELVEKAGDKDKFLEDFLSAYREAALKGQADPGFLEELLQAQIWKEANVNVRTILEYLMLKLEKTS